MRVVSRPMAEGHEQLPPLYERFLSELFEGGIPRESEATCSDCAMCAPSDEASGEGRARGGMNGEYFSSATKCCTFYPELPNFLLGSLLGDETPGTQRAREHVLAAIEAKVRVTPLGLARPASYALLFEHASDAFGRSAQLRCPHYVVESGACGMWAHRNGACATWFCKHVRGAKGQRFWKTVEHLLRLSEQTIARHAVLELDVGERAVRALFEERDKRGGHERVSTRELDEIADPERHAMLFGKWAGREVELYRASAAIAAKMSFADVVRVGGATLRALCQLARADYASLVATQVHPRLMRADVELVHLGRGLRQVAGKSARDPLVLEAKVLDALDAFDGGGTTESIDRARKEHGVRFGTEMVRTLEDLEILVPGD